MSEVDDDDYKYTKEYIAGTDWEDVGDGHIIVDGKWYTYYEVREALSRGKKDCCERQVRDERERILEEIISLENKCIEDSEEGHSQFYESRQLCDCVDCCLVSGFLTVRKLIEKSLVLGGSEEKDV